MRIVGSQKGVKLFPPLGRWKVFRCKLIVRKGKGKGNRMGHCFVGGRGGCLASRLGMELRWNIGCIFILCTYDSL